MQTNHKQYIITVDGGGTGCRAAVFTTLGAILAQVEDGPANIATDFETALGTITKTTSKAWITAGLETATIPKAIAVLGLAGANLGDVAQRIKARLPFAKSYVTDDRETTLRGALAGSDGCLAAIGTGSFFFAANSLVSLIQSAAGAFPQAMTAAAYGLVKTCCALYCTVMMVWPPTAI